MTLQRKAFVSARKRNLNKAIAPLIERLEERQMLAVVAGPWEFNYRFPGAADNEWGHIVVSQGVTADFRFLNFDEDTGAAVRTLVDDKGAIRPGVRPDGAPVISSYLYGIYVETATADSYISVTYQRAEPGGLVTAPFSDNAEDFRVANATNNDMITITPAGDTGKLLLGGREKIGEDHYLVTNAKTATAFGSYAPNDEVLPGLTVADGQDLGRFLFGGTVTGQVTIGGSMDLFYAGQLLTGTAIGVRNGSLSLPSNNPDNFWVKGDLRDLVVKASIGTHDGGAQDGPTYMTRFELKVDGRLGQVRSYSSFVGSVNVAGGVGTTQLRGVQNEVETRGGGADGLFLAGRLGDGTFFNDNFDTAQFVGSINYQSGAFTEDNAVYIRGVLAALDADNYRDWFDYYGVALVAGQTVEVQLNAAMYRGMISVGVFDPDRREIVTDYSDVNPMAVNGQAFRFTADRPGVYRFATGVYGNGDFVTNDNTGMAMPYLLRVSNVGNVTLGGVVASTTVYDNNAAGVGFNVDNGDLGAVYASGSVVSRARTLNVGEDTNDNGVLDPAEDVNGDGILDPGEDTNGNSVLDPAEDLNLNGILDVPAMSVLVANGNLRTIQGSGIGIAVDEGARSGLNLHVPNGLVGLLRSTTDRLWINPGYATMILMNPMLMNPGLAEGNLSGMPYVGKDYQLIDSGARFYGNLIAKQKLGVLRAADMATLSYSTIIVNADLLGNDGVIDLIDVGGNFGTIQAGGPHITTGPGGNVRYINVGGVVYSDYAFGGGSPQVTTFEPNETAIFNDDSGSMITLSPSGGGQLTITSYGIRGGGGVVLIRVESSGTLTVTGSNGSSNATAFAEIGRIDITGGGTTGFNPSVNIGGTADVDVFEITGGAFANIVNNTKGELVNITATSATSIQAQTIGLAKSSTPTAVNSLTIRSDVYPFSQQRNLISISGAVDLISARRALGNISVGSVNRVLADSDKIRAAGTFDGIVGPVYATGTMNDIDIGAGIAPAGNGNLAHAGVFAEGAITMVHGNVADIRGIVASNTSIGTIQLMGGSIINANILVGELADAREIADGWTMSHNGGTYSRPVYEIGLISVQGGGSTPGTTPGGGTTDPGGGTTPTPTGKKKKYIWINVRGRKKRVLAPAPVVKKVAAAPAAATSTSGGIIGTAIGAADIGTVRVSNGFGIIDSYMGTLGNGIIDRVEADGYGLRDVTLGGGAKINNIIAVGTGVLAPVTKFSASVRQAETQTFDPFFGTPPNALTDLYMYLDPTGTVLTKNTPSFEGLTNTGVNANMSAIGSRELGLLQAWRLQAIPDPTNSLMIGFNFANLIRNVQIANDVIGVRILTGKLETFSVGRDVTALNLKVAGPIGSITIGRNVDALTKIHAIGPSGSIGSIKIGGAFAGQIIAEYKIVALAIKSPWTGKVWEGGRLRTK